MRNSFNIKYLLLLILFVSSCGEDISELDSIEIIEYKQNSYIILEKTETINTKEHEKIIEKTLNICDYLNNIKNQILEESNLSDPLNYPLIETDIESFMKINYRINKLILDPSCEFSGFAIQENIDKYIEDILEIEPDLSRDFFEPIFLAKVYTIDGNFLPWPYVFYSRSVIKILQEIDCLKINILNVGIQVASLKHCPQEIIE
jgi:hypothetical protein